MNFGSEELGGGQTLNPCLLTYRIRTDGELKKIITNMILRLLAQFRFFQVKIFYRSKNKFALERIRKESFSHTISAIFFQFKTLEKKICDRILPNFNYKS